MPASTRHPAHAHRSSALALGAAICGSLTCGTAVWARPNASTASGSSEAHRTAVQESRVMVELVGPQAARAQLRKPLSAGLESAGWQPVLRGSADLEFEEVLARPPAPLPRARVFLVLKQPERAVLIIADDQRARWSIRSLPRTPGEEDVLHEQLVQVMLSSLEAIRAGAQFGADRTEALARLRDVARAPPAEAKPRKSPAKPTRPAGGKPSPKPDSGAIDVSASAAYELVLTGAEPRFAHGPRLGVLLAFDLGAVDVVSLGELGYRRGPTVQAASARGRVDAFPVRVGLGLGLGVGSWRLGFRLHGGVDVVTPRLDLGPELERASRTAVDPAAGLVLRTELTLGPDLGVLLDLGVDVYPLLGRYEVETPSGEAELLLEPARVRPSASLGLRVF